MLLAGLPEWFLKLIRESLFYRGLFPHVDLLIFMKMTLFFEQRGHFSTLISSRRFAHFYENDTFSSSKRVIFLRWKMTPGHYSARVIFCFTQAMVTSLYKRNIFEWDVKQSLIINQLISQSIYQYINQILTPHLRVFLDEHRILIAVFGNTFLMSLTL